MELNTYGQFVRLRMRLTRLQTSVFGSGILSGTIRNGNYLRFCQFPKNCSLKCHPSPRPSSPGPPWGNGARRRMTFQTKRIADSLHISRIPNPDVVPERASLEAHTKRTLQETELDSVSGWLTASFSVPCRILDGNRQKTRNNK